MKIEGVFFDLYGTLILLGDTQKAWNEWLVALREGLEAAGCSVGLDELARRCDGFLGQPEPPAADGLTVYERRLQRLCRQLGARTGPDDWRALADATVGRWQAGMRLDPEAVPVLERLGRHRQLALVSNFDHPRHVHRLVADLGLGPYFGAVVVSGEVGCKKPDPAIFAPALAATGLQAGQVAYVGDTDDDIGAAVAAGMLPVLVRRSASATVRLDRVQLGMQLGVQLGVQFDYRRGGGDDGAVKGHERMRVADGLETVAEMFGGAA